MGAGHFEKRRANYLCEQHQYAQAIALSPDSPRAYLALAAEQQTTGQAHLNFDLLHTAIQNAPEATPLLAGPWLMSYKDECL